ncbi:putrescine aminotransferase [Lactococcus lactis]|uniref:Putrescine aminotransferase n=1 Tax=Lactococcus lactis TaxID=1358 RepID=A0AAP5P9Q6_9LACT|nr:putrescine aminotransferase [Lactococcus lactis]MDT2860491.1 putrescine aminotransferase [Lactococcus lactis]MDT2868839.1 putrescine aminotransferase [Lactococcus lactis]MDT2879357.1 putrescine aminotransferase [Lactococcus lactis]MDT2881917.1 putrescine aminotransferase [Lactococcus lactis]MDT2897739.1 putrescine aminotransferase [Lactococcus lactis]
MSQEQFNFDKEATIAKLDEVIGYIKKDKFDSETIKKITDDTLEGFDDYVSPGWLKYRKSVSTDAAVLEWHDEGSIDYGLNDEEFIDFLGGFGIYTFGHRNQEILETVEAQLKHQALHSQELLDPLRSYLAKAVSEITPGDLQYSFFTNGGAEAVEMSLKLARIATGGRWYISTVGAFHGKSMGAISVCGKGSYREPYLPMIQQVQHVEYGNAEDMRKAIANLQEVGEKVAGIKLPPEGYLQEVRKIADEFGVALIFDEIQTGMGRTGKIWASEWSGVTPDIMTFGKSFGGGIMPITGIVFTKKMWVQQLIDNPWLLGSPTFGGNPLACSAALAAIRYMIKYDIPQQAFEKGEYLIPKLKEYAKKYPQLIQEVRGIGLMIGIEFNTTDIGYAVSKGLFSRGVMTAGTLVNAKTVRMEPPAIVTYEQIDTVLKRFGETLEEISKKL